MTSLIMSHFIGSHAVLCGLQHFNLRQNEGINGQQAKKCIYNRMGITILNVSIWVGLSWDMCLEIKF